MNQKEFNKHLQKLQRQAEKDLKYLLKRGELKRRYETLQVSGTLFSIFKKKYLIFNIHSISLFLEFQEVEK